MKKKRRKILITIMSIVLIGLIGVAVYVFWSQDSSNNVEGDVSMNLGQGLEVVEVGPYSGMFVEDETDEPVTDVLMIVIRNNSEKTLKDAEVTMKYGKQNAKFEFSTLLPEAEVVVLEKNRLAFSEESKIKKLELENAEFFPEEISMYEEDFQIIQSDEEFEVENVSDYTAKGPVSVYYKHWVDGRYLGGITYSIVIDEDIKPGDIIPVEAAHYTLDTGEIMYMTFGE